jgi:hypothetical protein
MCWNLKDGEKKHIYDFFYLCKKYPFIQQYKFETANPAHDHILRPSVCIATGSLPGFDQ